jgi:hypothetical protein
MSTIDLRCGRWQDTMADVECDALICDPPYSARTDKGYRTCSDWDAGGGEARMTKGHKGGGAMPRSRFELQYQPIDAEWASAFVDFFVPRVRSWVVLFGDHVSARWWADALDAKGLLVFAPVPWVRTNSTPRFMADGPANSCEWITIARPRGLPEDRFSRPGYYMSTIGRDKVVTGGASP